MGVLAGSALTLAALAAAGVFGQDGIEANPAAVSATTVAPDPQVRIQPRDDSPRVGSVAAAAIPSIVAVQVLEEDFAGDEVVAGSGSGVVFGEDGYVLTNNHVVEGASSVSLVFSDGRTYPAEVIGTDPLTDLAVLHSNAPDPLPIAVAQMAGVRIGDLAVAVGNPLGLEGGPSVTSGIVSAFDRTLDVSADQRLFGLIQTDAPITRGSSGGALLNGSAELIGITTAIGVSDVGAEGLGFAVPIDLVLTVAADLIDDGVVRHAFLGVNAQTLFADQDDGSTLPAGAEIADLTAGSAIEQAGARPGDVIVSLDGTAVSTIDQLITLLRKKRAGEIVDIGVLRDDASVHLDVTLDLHPDSA